MHLQTVIPQPLSVLDDEITQTKLKMTVQAAYQYLSQHSQSKYGLQSDIALDSQFKNSLCLGAITTGEFPSDMIPQQAEMWCHSVVPKLQDKLGCKPTAENFTEMLALKFLRSPSLSASNSKGTQLRQHWMQNILNQSLLSQNCWRFLFFKTKDFAADTDCTGVALAGLYANGAIDGDTLAKGALELLASAAVQAVSPIANQTFQKKQQGGLIKGVLKTYFEDQTFVHHQKYGDLSRQSGAAFRGCKHDPAVVVNAMLPILQALQTQKLHLDDTVQLQEYAEIYHPAEPDEKFLSRSSDATVDDIISANWRYIAGHLSQVDRGTRYYPHAETFLCFLSELFLYLPKETRRSISVSAFNAKIIHYLARVNDLDNPTRNSPLRLAQLIIAADNYNASMPRAAQINSQLIQVAKKILLSQVSANGAWPPAPCYSLGTSKHVFLGSEIITTIFAIRALEGAPNTWIG